MGLHSGHTKQHKTTSKPLHKGNRKGTRLTGKVLMDAWKRKGQAKGQG